MKKILLGLVMAMCVLTANAQFEAKKIFIDASFSGVGLSYSKQEKLRFDIDAAAGLFVARDFLVFARFGLDQRRVTLEKYGQEYGKYLNELTIGVGGRYYIEQNGIYLGAGVEYGHTEDVQHNYDNVYITPEVGYAFFVNQYLTLQPAIYYNICLNNFSEASKVGVRLGLGFYF